MKSRKGKSKNTPELINEIKELKDLVNQSSKHTQGQLQSIDNFLLIGSLLSFILAFWLSYLIDVLLYWVPASFILIVLWAIYALFARKRSSRAKSIKDINEHYKQVGEKQVQYKLAEIFRNSAPLIKAVGIIYTVTLFILILKENIPFPIQVPAISAFLLMISSFFVDKTVNFFEKERPSFNFQDFASRQVGKLLLILFLMIVTYILLMFFFPIWSLWTTRTLYYPISTGIPLLILVIILQAVTICIAASYLSSLSAKKELANALTNFADIDYQISDLLLSEEINEGDVERLKKLYLTAKRYDLVVSDTLKFVNFYYLKPNRVYVKKT